MGLCSDIVKVVAVFVIAGVGAFKYVNLLPEARFPFAA